MNAWSRLPNAQLIDWVLRSVNDNPELWYRARDEARVAAMDATRDEARVAAWVETCEADRTMAWYSAQDAARNSDWVPAQGAVLSLFAYDDCDKYLNMTYEQLRAWAILSETPQALLLLSLKWVQEHERLVTTTQCCTY